MKLLVTGATGFIGGKLVVKLIEEGHDVTCLVRKTSKTASLKKPGVSLAAGDITDKASVDGLFGRVCPDAVFHAAADVMGKNEESQFSVNVEGTRNIAEACLKYRTKKLIHVSSIAVINGNTGVPLTDDMPYSATNAYGRSKIEAEKIVLGCRERGLSVSVIRPCMVYGEGEPHLLDKIFELVRRRLLPVFDHPGMDAKINLVYVGNVVQLMMLALEKEEASRGTYLVADKETPTLREFVEMFYELVGSGTPLTVPRWATYALLVTPYAGKRLRRFFKERVYDISRAREILGYVPEVSTAEGMKRAVEDWRRRRKS